MSPESMVPKYYLRSAALIAALAVILLVANGSTSVFDRDEARFALAVRELREASDWILPTNYGEPRYHKPILVYWTARLSELAFGPGEFAWRFPSAVFGVLTAAATLMFARRHFGVRVALRATAVLGTTLVFVVESKVLTADAALLATTTLAFWAWYELRAGPRFGWQFLFWISVALGILAKGVNVFFLAAAGVAMLGLRELRRRDWPGRARAWALALLAVSWAATLPHFGFLGPVGLAILAVVLVLRGRTDPARLRTEWGALWGLPLALLIVGLWLVPALLRSHGAFLSVGVGHHMLERTARPFEGHRGVPGFYLVTSALALFPWYGAFLAAIVGSRRDERSEFLLGWTIGPWLLLECMASKLPHYILVVLPALSILLAQFVEEAGQSSRLVRRIEWLGFVVPCLGILGAALVIGLRLGGSVGIACGALAAVLLAWLLLSHGRTPVAGLWTSAAAAAAFLLTVILAVLPAYEVRRLTTDCDRVLREALRPGEPLLLVGYRPASLGCLVPDGHLVVQDAEAVQAAIDRNADGLFLIRADVKDGRFLADDGTPRKGWDQVATVQGLDGLRERILWAMRRRSP